MDTGPVTRRQVGEAAGLMVEAFQDDPGFSHVLPDARVRKVGLGAILRVAVRDSLRCRGARGALHDGRLAGVAAWYPPGAYPMTLLRKVAAVPPITVASVRLGSAMTPLTRLGSAVDEAFPGQPVWYLQALAVRSDLQRSGVGGSLLREGLARADAGGVDVYLETGNPANVPYYERFGFEVASARPEVFPGGPPMWFLRRPARGAGR